MGFDRSSSWSKRYWLQVGFCIKRDENGNVMGYKARLVAKSFR